MSEHNNELGGDQGPVYGSQGGASAPVPGEAAPRRRRGVLLATGGALAAVGLTTAGVLAFGALRGGGPQPEDIVPADALALVKLDLDPAGGQKISALRLMHKFPALSEALAGTNDQTDLRKLIFEAAQKDGAFKGVSYDSDVAPWIGDRFATAVIPVQGGRNAAPVILIATKDQAKAKAALAKSGTAGMTCDVVPDFVRCAHRPEVLTAFADGSASPLKDATAFRSDMKDLGEDGIASAWLDMGRIVDLAASQQNSSSAAQLAQAKDLVGNGRMFAALRFDGTDVELAGAVRDTKAPENDAQGPTRIGDLPEDTIAAVSINGLGDQLRATWTPLQKAATDASGGEDPFASLEQQYGISLPEDLIAALGNHTSLAVGGVAADGSPKIAITSDGDAEAARKLVSAAADQGQPLGFAARESVVVATDQAYSEAVTLGSGLGTTKSFVDAMPDVDKASSAFFVDIAGAVAAFGTDLPSDARANLAPLVALGMTGTQDGGDADFSLRLTTR